MAEASPPQLGTEAAYFVFPRLPLVPYTKRFGTLTLDEGGVTLRRKDRVVFNGAAHEFHSFAPCFNGAGFHLWQGRRLHVLVEPAHTSAASSRTFADPGARAVEHIAELASLLGWTGTWEAALRPVIAKSPPAGVRVRKPMSAERIVLLLTLGVFALMGVIAAVAVLTR
jgi:hypothetical protein